MQSKRFLANLVITLALGALFLPAANFAAFATGEGEGTTPPSQNQDTEEKPADNGPSIGGGLNQNTEKPTPQPSTPGHSQLVPWPTDSEIQPDTPQPAPAQPSTPAPTPTTNKKPQLAKPSSSTTPPTTTADESEVEELFVIPLAPNDTIAPEMEVPHTGQTESPKAAANLFAVALLVLSGITIFAAAVTSACLSRAARRAQIKV